VNGAEACGQAFDAVSSDHEAAEALFGNESTTGYGEPGDERATGPLSTNVSDTPRAVAATAVTNATGKGVTRRTGAASSSVSPMTSRDPMLLCDKLLQHISAWFPDGAPLVLQRGLQR